jgi:hypothetical protein
LKGPYSYQPQRARARLPFVFTPHLARDGPYRL